MASLAEAFIRIRADLSGVRGEVERDLGPLGGDAGKKSGRSFVKGFGLIAAAGVAVAGVALVKGLAGFVAEARESEKIGRLTAQVIKTTGGAAHVTAGQVSALATAISNKTGVDDEAVQSASNLLLTFTKVRNEVGEGNDIFNRATQAAVDMSTVLGTDASKSSIQLGKALNDPIKGITALSKAGVSFTDQQKKQIKTLVESGDVLGAQRIILDELGVEFGGAAAAASTPVDKLKVTVGNLKEAVGAKLLPVIDRFATFMLDTGIPALERFGATAKAGFADFASGIKGTGDSKGQLEALGVAIATRVVPALQAFGAWFMTVGVPAIKNYIGYWQNTVIPVIVRIYAQVIPAAVAAFNNVRAAIERNKPQLQSLWAGFKQVVDFLVTRVLPVMGPILAGTLQGMGMLIVNAIRTVSFMVSAVQTLASVVAAAVARIRAVWQAFWGGPFGAFARAAFALLVAVVRVGIAAVIASTRTVAAVIGLITGPFRAAVSGAGAAIGALVRLTSGIRGRIAGAIGDLGSLLYRAGAAVVDGMIRGIASKLSGLASMARKLADTIAKVVPGSPVREGPLTVLNRGKAGGLVATMLADGINAKTGAVDAAMRNALAVPGVGFPATGGGGSVASGGPLTSRASRGAALAGGITIAGDVILQGVQDPTALVKALQAYAARNGPIRLAVRT